MLVKYKMLIFDLDNTVFDYNKAENFALDKTLKYFECPVNDDIKESYRIINELTWQRFERGEISSVELRVQRFKKFGSTMGFKWDAAEVSRVYLENLGLGGFLIDGAEELLVKLRDDFRLAALTNGISEVQRARLQNSPLDGFFEPLVISDEAGVAKPDPGIFDILFKQAGITDRSEAIMIGDSLSSDIAGSVAAGVECCWYNPRGLEVPDENGPDWVAEQLHDFINIIYREE